MTKTRHPMTYSDLYKAAMNKNPHRRSCGTDLLTNFAALRTQTPHKTDTNLAEKLTQVALKDLQTAAAQSPHAAYHMAKSAFYHLRTHGDNAPSDVIAMQRTLGTQAIRYAAEADDSLADEIKPIAKTVKSLPRRKPPSLKAA